jgi:flagellar basal body-associated protein FliL
LSNDQSVNYTNIIIGVVVGILLFILAIVFYVWYNLRNRTQDIEKEGTKNESD